MELSSHEVGLVTGHNMERRLLPKIMIILDEHKHPLTKGKFIDLNDLNHDKENQNKLSISKSLPKGAYDINENEYLMSETRTRWSWKNIKGSIELLSSSLSSSNGRTASI